jgi:AcrR family transcriptional regulator
VKTATDRARTEKRRGRGRAPRPAWRKDPGGRQQRVLDAAARLFGANDYHTVTTAKIAAAAGVAEGTIYHHFGSKDGLLREAASRYGRGFADAMFAGFTPEAGVPDVEAVIRRAFAYVRFTDPSFGIFLLADGAEPPLSAKRANRDEIVSRLAGLFTVWVTQNQIRRAEPRILAELCFGLVEAGLRQCYALAPVDDDIEKRYVAEVSKCVRGMLAPAR